MSHFIGDLVWDIVDDTEAGLFRLAQPFGYSSDLAKREFTAPVGFETDGMTVPRIPGVYEILGNRGRKSGTIHDWLYSAKPVARDIADSILKEMLLIDGFSEVDADLCYAAVREFGGSHWK